jgi:hypothetical protein
MIMTVAVAVHLVQEHLPIERREPAENRVPERPRCGSTVWHCYLIHPS